MQSADIIIIGGGIVGLATAYQLATEYPNKKTIVIEKEPAVAAHQTGHNSGVLHTGIYYKPGSLKAINCRQGKAAMEAFCRQHDVDFEICGKVIVAIDDSEIPALENIYARGKANGVDCKIIDSNRLAEIEPYAAGVKAIEVPEAGIVNYRQVCETMAHIVQKRDGQIELNTKVTNIIRRDKQTVVETDQGRFTAPMVVNCAGLHCDRVTKMNGDILPAKIVPFRGEYYQLKPERYELCRTLIYPVPDPKLPFLGVHFTKMIDGSVECGPNAVLAFAREGYKKSTINIGDLLESLTYVGFLRMASNHWKMGMGEMWRSFSKAAFVKALQRLMPSITEDDLEPAPAGVRAQAVLPNGKMVDDFLIVESEYMIHVNNAPSPAATASLNIGRVVMEKAAQRF